MIDEVKQVLFMDDEGQTEAGIMVNGKEVICACCGSLFEIDEDCHIVKEFPTWVNFSYEIGDTE